MSRRITAIIQRIERLETPILDRHNNPVREFADPVPVPVWLIAPRERDEPRTQDRDAAVSTVWDIYAPPGTTIGAQDRVQLPTGQLCEVVGEVGVWAGNPNVTWTPQGSVQFTVQRKEG